jgi:hypothetical protein
MVPFRFVFAGLQFYETFSPLFCFPFRIGDGDDRDKPRAVDYWAEASREVIDNTWNKRHPRPPDTYTQEAIALLQLRPILRISNPTLLLLFSPISSEIGQMCTHTTGKSKSIRRFFSSLPHLFMCIWYSDWAVDNFLTSQPGPIYFHPVTLVYIYLDWVQNWSTGNSACPVYYRQAAFALYSSAQYSGLTFEWCVFIRLANR